MCAIVGVVLLTGCTPRASLDTPQLRQEAVQKRLEEIRDALQDRDATAIDEMACTDVRLILPVDSLVADDSSVRMELIGFDPLAPEDIEYADPEPGGDFFVGEFRDENADPLDEDALGPVDAIVRVDRRAACLWAIGPHLALFIAL